MSNLSSIVAIHGLDGDPRKSWDEDGVIWFADLLPKDLPEFDLRISTFGYNSKILFCGSAFQTRDFATDLLSNLQLRREKVRPGHGKTTTGILMFS